MLYRIIRPLLIGFGLLLTSLIFLLLGIAFNWFGSYTGTGTIELTKSDVRQQSPQYIFEGSSKKQILFGDLHVHTTYSLDALTLNFPIAQGEGAHPVADACNYARFCANLDFFAVTDHAEWLTKREWKDSLESIQQCEKVSSNLDKPAVVPFLGWEWTQTSLNRESHYGHKNIIIKSIEDNKVPSRPISASGFDDAANASTLIVAAAVAFDFPNRKHYFDWRYKSLVANSYSTCTSEKEESKTSHDCYIKAQTPSDLFKKLKKLDTDLLVIPHGTSWGVTSPPLSSWENQLKPGHQNEEFNRLIEIYSGHGNSEEYRPWRSLELNNNGNLSCAQPTKNYIPDCFQAGEIIRERCRVAAGSTEECNKRAEEAKSIFVKSNPLGLFSVPGYDPFEWKDSGQCKDCFLPAFDYRPKMSAQYALALSDFSSDKTIRYRYGFIGSSDNHQARPGNGFKENQRKLNSEARADMDNEIGRNLLNPRLSDPRLPRSEEVYLDLESQPGLPLQSERGSSFLYTGGLVAAHSKFMDRENIWDSMNNREVYATSGERILLWFDLINAPNEKIAPMGTELFLEENPTFRVQAVGAQKQLPGCVMNSSKENKEIIERLCKGECFNPSDERKIISRIEVVRIRPQIYKDEPIDTLIEDPWKTFLCEPSQEGCSVEFSDEKFISANREIIYYVRAIQEPSQGINGGQLNCETNQSGQCIEINLCGDPKGKGTGECLSEIEERAWSSPIFVKNINEI
tara:strand:- start:55402 stop:57624 length:2223 start_codon:yes stop_codon:yes gene_type:complete